ncbi:MAG: hypothetical protein WBQ22_17105, partial [Bradyrhizobium sp.]
MPSTSEVAVCRSSASFVSSNRRAFSMAIVAWSAKVCTRSIWLLVNGPGSGRVSTSTPSTLSFLSIGTPSAARILTKEPAGISMSGSSSTSGITSIFPDAMTREVAEPRPALGGLAAQYFRNSGVVLD